MYPQGDSPGGGAGCPGGAGGGGAGGAGGELCRRPVLPAAPPRLDPLEDEHSLRMLYDYTTVYAW